MSFQLFFTEPGMNVLHSMTGKNIAEAIGYISLGSACYELNEDSAKFVTALRQEEDRQPIAENDFAQLTLIISALFDSEKEYSVGEVGVHLTDESQTLLAVYSSQSLLLHKSKFYTFEHQVSIDVSPVHSRYLTVDSGINNGNLLLIEPLVKIATSAIISNNMGIADSKKKLLKVF